MACTNTPLREMLPSFREGSLDADAAGLVRDHLAQCSDCSHELELLSVMADDQVPDPGEAFWRSLSDRVYGETRRGDAGRRTVRWWQGAWWDGMPLRGAIAVALVVLVAWVLIRPAHHPLQETAGPSREVSTEDLYEEPAAAPDVGPSDIPQLSDWLEREISALREDLGRTALSANGFNHTLAEDLAEMEREELDDIVAALSEKQEV